MKRKTRVLFVIPTLLRAGAQTQLVELVNALDGEKFDRYVYTFERRVEQAGRLAPDVRFFNRIRRGRFDLEPAREMARLIDEESIDVVHCTMQFGLLQGALAVALSRRRPPFIDALHTTINRNRKDELLDRLLYRWFMARASAVICVCDTQARVWVRKFPFLGRKMCVVHNGVDTRHYQPGAGEPQGGELRRELGIADEDYVIASVAAFRPEKGHDILFKAMQEVVRRFPQTHLLLAGDGPLQAAVEASVQARGLQAHVHFLGNRPDVRPVLGTADLSVIASTAVETFSMAMLESLAMKVPVVTSDIGGSAEAIIDGVTGRVVPVGDAVALGEAMLGLLANDEVRRQMGENGRTLVLERFTREGMTAKTARVLQGVASGEAFSDAAAPAGPCVDRRNMVESSGGE